MIITNNWLGLQPPFFSGLKPLPGSSSITALPLTGEGHVWTVLGIIARDHTRSHQGPSKVIINDPYGSKMIQINLAIKEPEKKTALNELPTSCCVSFVCFFFVPFLKLPMELVFNFTLFFHIFAFWKSTLRGSHGPLYFSAAHVCALLARKACPASGFTKSSWHLRRCSNKAGHVAGWCWRVQALIFVSMLTACSACSDPFF